MRELKQSIFKYLFISLLAGISVSVFAQVDTTRSIRGISLGLDLSRFIVTALEPVHNNFELSLGFTVTENIQLQAEGGYLNVDFSDTTYTYKQSGSYYRFGAEYNLLKRQPGEQDQIYVGLMYGYSPYSHEAENITISDGYWGMGEGSLPLTRNTAHWIEIKGGLRVELWRNLFVGYALRLRIFLAGKTDPKLDPYLIPGYGKAGKTSTIGMSYSIFYRIPLGDKKR